MRPVILVVLGLLLGVGLVAGFGGIAKLNIAFGQKLQLSAHYGDFVLRCMRDSGTSVPSKVSEWPRQGLLRTEQYL